MISVKCKCANGYTWHTSVNGRCSDADIKQYFVGQVFNTASYPLEIMSECIEITIDRSDVH